MRTRKFAQLAAAMALTFSAAAQASTVQCDRCTPQQMVAAAEPAIYEDPYRRPAYVVDVPNGIVRKYGYYNDKTENYNPEFDYYNEWIAELPVEPEAQRYVDEMRAISIEMAKWPPFVIDGNNMAGKPTDAQQAINRSDLELALIQAIEQTHGAQLQRFADATTWAVPPFFDGSKINIVIKVLYPDGSYAHYAFDSSTGHYKRVPGSSRDSVGNLIPEKKEDAAGRDFYFPNVGDPMINDDYNDMIDRVNRMGYRIVYPDNLIGHGRVIQCREADCIIVSQ